MPRLAGTTLATHGGALEKTLGPRSQFTRSFECNDGTPRPVVNTQNSSLHLMMVDGSCTPTLRIYGATFDAVTELLMPVEAAGDVLDDNTIARMTFARRPNQIFFIGLEIGWIQ